MSEQDSKLADELREMGKQIKDLAHAAAEHPKTKEFEEKISQAVKDMTHEIDGAMARAQASEPGQRVKKAGEELIKTGQAWKDSGAPEEIARGLAASVQILNQQIRRAVDELKKESKA